MVVPVGVLGRELVRARRLNSVNPSGDGELALTLQECGVGRDELLRLLLGSSSVLSSVLYSQSNKSNPVSPIQPGSSSASSSQVKFSKSDLQSRDQLSMSICAGLVSM